MTVYDYCHLGHARVMVAFDVVYRYLKVLGYDVTYVRNITDIDDKILKRAQELHEPFTNLTERFIKALHEDTQALGTLPPDQEPRATAHIPQILHMVEQLLNRGYAYVADNGDVYYAVNAFPEYGKLSGKAIEDLQAGARVEVIAAKKHPLDFVLWKAAKAGEPSWDSPWGLGRPGWHIECSAMATHCLGQHIDIHGGGADLQFPHHENEIAQSEGAHDGTFVNIWMHNGFVKVNEEKMAKSLGNFFTIREILQHYRPEVVRYFILSSHYRSPLHYDEVHLHNARAALTRFYTALRGLDVSASSTIQLPKASADADVLDDFSKRFYAAMDDDFNTPEALAVLFDLVRELNSLRFNEPARNGECGGVPPHISAVKLAAVLRNLGGTLGILQDVPETFLTSSTATDLADTAITTLIQQRTDARTNKSWAAADRIRNLLLQHKVVLEDGPNGTTWRRLS